MGTGETHKKNRARRRKRLLAQGFSSVPIEDLLYRLSGSAKPRSVRPSAPPPVQPERERARVEEETYRRLALDDRRHRPTSHDPLTTGIGRATGATAVAAKRGRTMTKWQYDELVGVETGEVDE
jgi:hypothetical protein